MNLSLVSVRYAKALFKLSVEKGITEEVYENIQLLLSNCTENTSFCEFVRSPVVKPSKKKKLFDDVFGKILNPVTLNFLKVVIDNNRELILDLIFRGYISFYKKEKNIKTVTLYSAFEMEDAYVERVRRLLIKEIGEPLELKTIKKEDLLGGFILKVDDKMVDASVTGKLKQVKEHLIKG